MIARVKRVGKAEVEVSMPAEAARRAGFSEGDSVSVFAPGGELLVLAREPSRTGHLVGTLATLGVPEVFGVLCSEIRWGTVIFEGPECRRSIVLRDGEVTFANSSDTSERLGPVLFRYGLITLEQLEEMEPKVRAGLKLGKALVDAGHLTPAHLYRGMQLQIREIVLGAFSLSQGRFAFIDGDPGEVNTVKLPERTRDLVLEGMSRADDLGRMRQRVSGADRVFFGEGMAQPLDSHQAAVLKKAAGALCVADLFRTSTLGEYAGMKAVLGLLQSGHLWRSAEETERRPAAVRIRRIRVDGRSPLQTYKNTVRYICEQLAGAGAPAGRLNSFFKSLPEGLEAIFAGVCLTASGELDVETVLENAQRLHEGAGGKAIALEALDAFVAFALFDVRNVLPNDLALAVAKEVARALEAKQEDKPA